MTCCSCDAPATLICAHTDDCGAQLCGDFGCWCLHAVGVHGHDPTEPDWDAAGDAQRADARERTAS